MNKKIIVAICAVEALLAGNKPPKKTELEKYLESIQQPAAAEAQAQTPGSLYSPGTRMVGLGLDIRANQVNDLITVIVAERASAVSKGTTSATRSSNAKASITGLYGPAPAKLGGLLDLSSSSDLAGEGTTTRESTLNTSITARVVQVMPNGNLVIEGVKNVTINSENQAIVLRGIVRPVDISGGNAVSSERIAAMDIRVNGKGVVGDAIRRPNFLYRLLLGILPF
jgi:flagellar L-ring protein precursor FlgH